MSPPPVTPVSPPYEPPTDPKASDEASARPQSDFDQFWSAYPAKVGKKAAQQAWSRAKDRPPLADLLAALERYRRTKPADRDWCHPSTWLNQGRWDDEDASQAVGQVVALPSATFDGPPEVRVAIVAAKDEDFARKYVDPYCRWRAEDRTLLVRTPGVAAIVAQGIGDWAARSRVRIEAEAANSPATSPPRQTAA